MNRQSQWLFEAPTLEVSSDINPKYYTPDPLATSSKLPIPQTCDNRRPIPKREVVRRLTPPRVACSKRSAFNQTDDPFGVISRAVTRAIEMLDNTIDELTNARNAVCQGATPAWPLLGDITLCLLKNGLSINTDDIKAWTANAFVNRSVAEVIRRLVRVRNLIGSNGIRYSCSSPDCKPNDWAFVIVRDSSGQCLPGTPQMLVRLCRQFWVPKRGVDPKVHAEFQAQTIIHEASHLTHCNPHHSKIKSSRTIGGAECLTQFVAATNGSPIDPDFAKDCIGMKRCFPKKEAQEFESARSGFTRSGSIRFAKTIFQPQNAIQIKGRPAMRR
jgi:hypothetical protein